MRLISKPAPAEYPAYAGMYMKLLPDDGRILHHLDRNYHTTKDFIYSLPGAKLTHAYAPGKWTIKEVLVHIIDDERIFAYRAMSFARNEKRPMPGFDQDDYAEWSAANDRSLAAIFDEYEAVRRATIALYKYLPEDSLQRRGTGSSTYHSATVRALAYHIAGHELHHVQLIKDHYI